MFCFHDYLMPYCTVIHALDHVHLQILGILSFFITMLYAHQMQKRYVHMPFLVGKLGISQLYLCSLQPS